mmetsp:Transcript_44745/g.126572  ORF Transcript_44745/g.126572 Transcript_44745/m.126572 type:complete len:169 (-) Transcript_44745:169-675(-)
MKPDWDKLMAEYKGSETTLVADVDCTAAGKAKCEEVGVRGYPTIKYGDPEDLQDYKGGRSLAELKTFAAGLGPQCSPSNLELCDEVKKKQIAEYSALSSSEREAKIGELEGQMKKIESDFKAFVEGLNTQYKAKTEQKEKDSEELKNSGLGLLKSVHAYEKKSKTAEL